MIDILYSLLSPIAPTEYLKRPSEYPSITYLFTVDEDDYADNEATEINYNVQIDVWVKELRKLKSLTEEIRNSLLENSFTGFYYFDLYEEKTKIWHRVIDINYLENIESEE